MRWLYYDPLCPPEVEFRAAMSSRFAAFWRAFGEKVTVLESALSGGTAWDWNRWLSGLLHDVDHRLQWEIVPGERPEHWRLAISPQTHRELRPMLHAFVAQAPQIPDWSFHEWLPRLAYPLARRWARQRTGGDCDQLAVTIRRSPAGNLDLLFMPSPDAAPASQQSWLTVAYSASEAILGEELFDHLIGSVSLAEPTESRSWWQRMRQSPEEEETLPMAQLWSAVEEHRNQLLGELPAQPLSKLIASRGWTTLQLEPAGDVPDSRDADLQLLTASVAALPLLTAARGGRRFCSSLHSRCGETFCYVQWRHDAGSDEALLERREQLDQILSAALAEAGAGCVIGGGIGQQHLYFDLAATDLAHTPGIVRRALLPHRPPEQSWLLFYDDELAAEWIGIHPDAPTPPGRT